MRVLGIETSCDETGVAIADSEHGLMANALFSQVAEHAEYGGVVPELASRDHVRKLVPLLKEALAEARSKPEDIDAIAYTAGPGLMGALLVGASFARSLAYGWGCNALPVHHLEGHLLVPLLDSSDIQFPFTALLVSGGHTQLFAVNGLGDYTLLGESLDDAAGEAFDKTAKLLGLAYPGGPVLAKLADSGRPGAYKFPRPMTDRPGLDFSFSGLKTHARTTIQQAGLTEQQPGNEQARADIAHAFQAAVVDTLQIKCKRAMQQTGHKQLVVAGGVGANRQLREQFQEWANGVGLEVAYPRIDLCTDNGAMIAYAGLRRLDAGLAEPTDLGIQARARWPLANSSSN